MSLYEKWQEVGSDFDAQEDYNAYWEAYFKKEMNAYKKILGAKQTNLAGTVEALASDFDLTSMEFVGFLDGINTSLDTEVDLDNLTEASEVNATIDFEKLLFNMHAAKADWLFELDEWADIFDEEKRKDIRKAYMQSKTVVKEEKIGRNDPCPCGSGKKHKKCCGNN